MCDEEGVPRGYCQNPLAQTQERILDLLMELGDKHLLLSDLLSLSCFRRVLGFILSLLGEAQAVNQLVISLLARPLCQLGKTIW